MQLTNHELYDINGGATTLALSATLLSSLSSLIKNLYTIGQSIGTSIRRVSTGTTCSAD